MPAPGFAAPAQIARRKVVHAVPTALVVGPVVASLMLFGVLWTAVPGSSADPSGPAMADGSFAHIESWLLPPALPAPIDVAIDDAGTVYVADGDHNEVLLVESDGKHAGTWGPPPFNWPGYILIPRAVEVDSERQKVYILWERRNANDPVASPPALFLDERLPDGSASRPSLAITFAESATDMALHEATGDLYFTAAGQVHRLRMPARVHAGSFPVGRTEGAYGRLAATADGRLALPRPDTNSIALYDLQGGSLGAYTLGSGRPVAIAADGDSNVCTLLARAAPYDRSAPVVSCLDTDGSEVKTFTGNGLGASAPPDNLWPWALDMAAGRPAFSTSDARFEVRSADADGAQAVHIDGAIARSQYVPRPPDTRAAPALSLSAAPSGELIALDAREGRLVTFGAGGESRLAGAVPKTAVDVTVGGSGERYVSTSDNTLMRLAPGDTTAATWQVDCNCDLGGRVDSESAALYVSRPRMLSVAAHDAATGAPLREIAYPEGVGLWPSDVAVGVDGRLFTADLVMARVQGWTEPSAPDVAWQAGLLAGPRRLAAGRMADGTDVVAAVMADGHVELHAAADGNLLARWRAETKDGDSFDAADIALGSAGTVYLADGRTRAVHVFGPGAAVPTPVADRTPTPTPSDLSCTVFGNKRAAPSRVVAGEDVTVTLNLSADCPANTKVVGADIVLAIDRSSSMSGTKMTAAQGAARSFAELLDVRHHRLGVVTFSTEATIGVKPTDDVGLIIEHIEQLTLDPLGQTNITAAIERAREALDQYGRPESLPVIVLLTDGRHNIDTPDPRISAEQARNWGAQIYTIGLGSDVDESMLSDIAGNDDRYFFAPTPSELFPIYGQILRQVLDSLAGNLIIDDELGDMMTYVAGSARPDALVSPGRLRWGRSILPASGVTITYTVRPSEPGCRPTNRRAVAEYTDGDGARRQYEFPVPTICVVTPTPMPSATPTPAPITIVLPLVQRNHCTPGNVHADVVLLIDTSDSMSGDKLRQARAAAAQFVGLLDLPHDQAAVIGFNNQQTVAAGLTGDRELLLAALLGITSGRGTYIDRALQSAANELQSPRRRARNRPMVILLSDGAHNGPASDVIVAADRVRRIGAVIYAVGLGADADQGLLSAVSGPDRYYYAPEPSDLAAIYAEIAIAIPCP